MNNLKIAAIPVNHDMAVKKHWGKMPLEELEKALNDKTGGLVLRIDRTPGSALPGVVVDPLYFDVIL